MEEKKPIQIILDTDIGWDCDDAGALALIHRLCDKGEAKQTKGTDCASYKGNEARGKVDILHKYADCAEYQHGGYKFKFRNHLFLPLRFLPAVCFPLQPR